MEGKPVEGFQLQLAALQILDLDGDAVTSDVIFPPTDLSLFSDPLITIDFTPVGSSQNRIWVDLNSLRQVPEPNWFVIWLIAPLFAARWR